MGLEYFITTINKVHDKVKGLSRVDFIRIEIIPSIHDTEIRFSVWAIFNKIKEPHRQKFCVAVYFNKRELSAVIDDRPISRRLEEVPKQVEHLISSFELAHEKT